MSRSTLREVRNPVLALPSAKGLQQLPPFQREGLRALLRELAADCRARADKCWKQHKAPMAAYWKACAVYAGHVAKVLGPRQRLAPVTMHCRDCGSENISKDATVRWCVESQEWEVSGIFDCTNCDDCGKENDWADEKPATQQAAP